MNIVNGIETSVARELNEDPAFVSEGIFVRHLRLTFDEAETRAIAIFDSTKIGRDRVAVVAVPVVFVNARISEIANVLFARIYSKVVTA